MTHTWASYHALDMTTISRATRIARIVRHGWVKSSLAFLLTSSFIFPAACNVKAPGDESGFSSSNSLGIIIWIPETAVHSHEFGSMIFQVDSFSKHVKYSILTDKSFRSEDAFDFLGISSRMSFSGARNPSRKFGNKYDMVNGNPATHVNLVELSDNDMIYQGVLWWSKNSKLPVTWGTNFESVVKWLTKNVKLTATLKMDADGDIVVKWLNLYSFTVARAPFGDYPEIRLLAKRTRLKVTSTGIGVFLKLTVQF